MESELGQAVVPAAGALLALGLSSTSSTRTAANKQKTTTTTNSKTHTTMNGNNNSNNGMNGGGMITLSPPAECPASKRHLSAPSQPAKNAPKNEHTNVTHTHVTPANKSSNHNYISSNGDKKTKRSGSGEWSMSDMEGQMRAWRSVLLSVILQPSTLLIIAACSFSISWFMMFSWQSLAIQCLAGVSLLCVMSAVMISVQRHGLLAFTPSPIRKGLTELSLMDIAQIPWNSQLVTDIATLFVFPLSEAERNAILQQIPPHIRSVLVTKGIVNLLPRYIKPFVTPQELRHHARHQSRPSLPAIEHTSASTADQASPMVSTMSESKRAVVEHADAAALPPPVLNTPSHQSSTTSCPVTRVRSMLTTSSTPSTSSSTAVVSPAAAASSAGNITVTHGGSTDDKDSVFARQFRVWSVAQLGNKRLHNFVNRIVNSRTATSIREAMVPHLVSHSMSVLPSRRTLNILAATAAFTLGVQYMFSPGTRRWTRRWTAFGMESSLYIAVTIALAGLIATGGFSGSSSAKSHYSSLSSPAASSSSSRGVRGAVFRLLRFERRHHKVVLSMLALAGWVTYLARAYKARLAAGDSTRVAAAAAAITHM